MVGDLPHFVLWGNKFLKKKEKHTQHTPYTSLSCKDKQSGRDCLADWLMDKK